MLYLSFISLLNEHVNNACSDIYCDPYISELGYLFIYRKSQKNSKTMKLRVQISAKY